MRRRPRSSRGETTRVCGAVILPTFQVVTRRYARYCSAVETSRLHLSEASSRVADAMQAAYFRGILADELADLSAYLAKQRGHLAARSTTGDQFALSRLRREIKATEAQVRYVGRLIDAVERRFAAHWESTRQA